MVVGQFPALAGVQVLLRAQVTVEQLVGTDGRVDQQGLEAMALGQVSGIVAAERAADQQRPAQFTDRFFQLHQGLAGMVVQRRDLQLLGQPQVLHGTDQLAGLARGWSAVEAVNIKNRTRHAASKCH
ncbi:hypothetical protein D3C85_1076860 [compost metagenome]